MKKPRISPRKSFHSACMAAFPAVLFAAKLPTASAAVSWDGGGDGVTWTDPLNWDTDTVPTAADLVVLPLPGIFQQNGNQAATVLGFFDNVSLGSAGNSSVLTLAGSTTSANIAVDPGILATLNTRLTTSGATPGVWVGGGGTLYLANQTNFNSGPVTVDASTLMISYPGQVAATSRSDALQLGVGNRTVNLINGGEFKLIGSSYNPDGTTKVFALGTGGGKINVAAGYQHMVLDDAGQITAAAGSSLTKTGNGTLQLLTQDYNLDVTGGVNINGGLLRLSRVQGNTANSRFSAFTAGSAITINSGGKLVLETGTQGVLNNNVTLNSGGVLAINGAEHNIGARTGAANTLTLNGGTILVRDGLNPQSSGRLPRIDAKMTGSGTIDLIGGTANAGNSRFVIQRADAGTDFTGTFVVHGNTAIEQNPRDNGANVDIGNTLGSATVDLRGHNATLDMRDSDPINGNLGAYSNVKLTLSGEAGSVSRLVVNRSTTATGTGNVYQFGNFTTGSNRLYMTNGNSFGMRFSGNVTLAGASAVRPVLDINATAGKLEFNGNWNEHVAGDGLQLTGRLGNFDFSGSINLTSTNLMARETRLFGANGSINPGSISGLGELIIDSGYAGITGTSTSSGTILHLNNNLANTGGSVAAATNNDRLNNNVPIGLYGDSVLRLTSQSGVAVNEVTGDISALGRPTVDLVKTGTLTAPMSITLGNASPPALGTGAAANLIGTSLGAAGVDSSRIIIPSFPTTPFMGSNITSGNEWAAYSATVDSGMQLGVVPWIDATYGAGLNALEAAWVPGMFVKLNGATGTALGAARNLDTLNLQFSAANQSIDTAGSLLTVERSGIIVAANNAGIVGGAAGGLTAGTGSPTELHITNNNQLDLNAIVSDNGGGGRVTLVKNGTGLIRLTNQGFAVGGGAGAVGSIIPATHTNTFSGGIIINQGIVSTWRPEYLGTGNTVTINGGALDLNIPVAPATLSGAGLVTSPGGNNSTINIGTNLIFNASGGLYADDNGEGADASVGGNATLRFGKLTINGEHVVGIGSYGNGQLSAAMTGASPEDFLFSDGAAFSGTPTINIGVGRSGGAVTVIQGALTGSAFNLAGLGTAVGTLQLGNGGADNTPNAYTGTILIQRTSADGDPVLRLNKANGVNAVTGDIIINGGTLAWGSGSIGDYGSNVTVAGSGAGAVGGANVFSANNPIANQFTGNVLPSAFANATSGADQIPDTASVTLMFGTVNESARYTFEKFRTLRQLNGNFNTGFGKIDVDTYEMSGGSISFNSGGTFAAGTVNLLSGAQDINIANNFAGTVSRFEVGAGGLTVNGQNFTFGNNDYFNPSAGAVLQLGGPLTVQADPLNFTNEDRQRGFFSGGGGRELAPNWVDLAGGTRTISVKDDIFYTVNVGLRNGGIVKEGDGTLAVQNWFDNNYSGGVTVNNGIFQARSRTAAGSGAIDINSGGTLKMDGGWTWSNAVTVSGAGADIPQSSGILEIGALVSEAGQNRLTGAVAIDGNAAIGSNLYQIPVSSRIDAAGGVGQASPLIQSNLRIESAGGVTGTGSLTLSGGGSGLVVNGVNVTGGLTKTGNGTWSLGAGTYAGATSVESGVLRATAAASLGGAAQGTTVYGGATLQLDNAGASSERVTAHGLGQDGLRGAVESFGTSGLSQVTIGTTPTAIRSSSGTLTISGNLVGGSGGNATILTGAGSGVVAGTVTGTVSSGDGLIKNGTGTWSLLGNSTFSGNTAVNGGALVIGGAFPATSAVSLGGGLFRNAGAAALTTNGLNVTAAGGSVDGGAGANVGAIVRSPGGTVSFLNSVTTSTPNTNGILGGWATYGNDWAVGGGPISGFSAYTNVANATGTIGAGNQGRLAYDGYGYAYEQHTAALAGETLKVSQNLQGLQAAANNITLGAGGLLKEGGGVFNLGGTGILSGATANDDLSLHVNGGGLYVSAPLIGAGSGNLSKAGPGDLRALGSSSYTGSINVNGGTFSITGAPAFASTTVASPSTIGSSVMGGNRVMNLNGGTFALLAGDWDLNDWDTATAGIQSIQFNIGTAGGILYSGNGQLLINDTAQANNTAQLMGSGDLTVAGGGRVAIDNAFPQFTGDINVTGGVLRLGNGANGNQSAVQKVTMQPGTALIINATDLTQSVDFKGGNQVTVLGADRAIRGPVTFAGNIDLIMQERDTISTARSLEFAGPVSGSGTLNISGTNTNGRVQFAGGFSDYTGTVNVGPNSTIEIRQPGSFGSDLAMPTINLNGSRSRLMLRHYQNGDWNVNVNAAGKFAEIYSGRVDNYGLGSQGLFSVNNVTSAANNYLTLTGDNSNWTTVRGTFTGAGDQTIVTNSNAILLNGGTVGGILDKRGGSVLATEGTLAVTGKTVIQQGWIDLRGAGGKLTTTGIELRGGNLLVSNNAGNGSDANRIAGIPISMGGGSLRVVGTTNLGAITLAPGTSELNYAMDTQAGVTPLVINDIGATRAIGSQFRVNSTYGTVGNPTGTSTNARIHVTGMADRFGTGLAGSVDIIPWGVFSNNFEFLSYRTTSDSGQALGLVQVTNGSMRADAADGTGANQLRSATASTEIMRFTGTATTTLAGNATWRAIKMDGGATRTIALGGNTLTVDRGHIIFVSNNNQRIGVNTAGSGTLTSGNSELHITANQSVSLIGAVVANGPAGTVHLVKNGAGSLRFDGDADNTFTGNVHLNGGVLVNNRLGHVPSGATVFFNGGRWEPSPTAALATDVLAQGNNLVVNTNSSGVGGNPALSLDNGTGPQDNDIAFGSVTINNGVEWSIAGWDGVDGIFNATGGNPHVFNGTPTVQLFQGRTGTGTNEAVMTFAGPITGSGFRVQALNNVAGTNPSNTTMNIGGGAGDTAANTYAGDFVMLGTGNNGSMPIVRLNKAPGTTALTGDVYVYGGQLVSLASNQIADTANVTIASDVSGSNQMGWNLNNQSETINNLIISGSGVSTGTGTLTANNITVNMGSQADNLQITTAGGTVIANGLLTVNDFGSVTLGASAATLVVNGGLTMTGGRITQSSGGGNNIVRLNSDVTATSSAGQEARLGNSTDSDTFLELNDLRTFTVADGNMGYDLNVSSVIRNSTAPGAAAGGLVKTGPGLMILQGGGTANSYTAGTRVDQGTLQLAKNAGVNAVPGNLAIGIGAFAARVEVRNSNQIADSADISIANLGTLDLQTFNTSESIRNLSSASGGMTTLGPSSALTVNITADTIYAGSIVGGGATAAVTKNGAAKWTLTSNSEYSGDTVLNAGILQVDGFLNGSSTLINATATLQGTGRVSDVVLIAGGTLSPGQSPGVLTTRNIQATGGTVSYEINGLTPGAAYDQLRVLGEVDLGSAATFNLTQGVFTATTNGDIFWLIVNDGTDPISGAFSNVVEGQLVTVGGDPNFFYTYQANAEGNSITGGNDFAIVPEPGSAMMLCAALVLPLLRRRRKS